MKFTSYELNGRSIMSVLRICWTERTGIKPLSEELEYHRWSMIGHILRQDRNNDRSIAISWAPEGKRKIRGPKKT